MSEPAAAPTTGESKKFEFKRAGYLLTLTISPDQVECRCTYQPNQAGAPLSNDDLNNFLKQARIIEGISIESVKTLLAAAVAIKPVDGLLLAQGTPMQPGADGLIQLEEQPSGALSAETAAEDSAKIDFHKVQHFFNVSVGQLIARILPPAAGMPGKNVHGDVIPAKPGSVLIPVLAQNVRLDADGCSIYALCDGRVCLNGPEISVEDTLTIKGDVDFKVGDISFNGFVDIKGDVLDDFSVRGSKGIKIQGNIGICRIESDGDILFCGMSGQGKGSIACRGSITANFLNDVTVECAGDISIESEIRNCHIHCLGSICVNKGVLAGGDYVALGGIEAGNIGTVTSLHTHVAAGVNYHDLEEMNQLFNELKELINQYTNNKHSSDIKEFSARRAAITERIQQVRSREHAGRNPKVNAKKMLYENVNITLGAITEDVTEAKSGPLSVIENTVEGGFRYIAMTELQVKAAEIERAYVQQAALSVKQSEEEQNIEDTGC